MKDPRWITSIARRPWSRAFFVILSILLGREMLSVSGPVQPPALSLEFPWTQRGADELLSQWNNVARGQIRSSLFWDVAFIVGHAGFLAVAAALAAQKLAVVHWPGAATGAWVVWSAIVAGGLDVAPFIVAKS